MRIGIDAHVLGKGSGGVERFLSWLVELLPTCLPQHQFVVFINRQAAGKVPLPQHANVEYVTLASANPLIERSLLLPWLVRRHRLDQLLIQRLAPWLCGRCQLITTVHDITPLKFPAAYPGLSNTLVRLFTGNSVRRSALVLTPTRVIADEVSQWFALPPARVVPFYNGVDTQAFCPPADTQARQPYIFISGAIEKRKNLETLLRARAALGPAFPWRVRIAGGVRNGAYRQELEQLVQQLGLQQQVDWLGFVSEDELIRLYQQASVFVTTSRDEGFNIPPLEAMACGTPVLCSDIAVHRELFAEGAQLFATEDDRALAQLLQQLADDARLRAEWSARGRQCAQHYSWSAMADRVARALQDIPTIQ